MQRGCAALVVLAWSALSAAADPLATAKQQVASSEYLKARASLDVAYASGKTNRDQLAELWQLRGIVAGALGDTKAATAAFQRALALDPKADLRPGTSPKITRPFDAAKDYFKSNEPLAITQKTRAKPPAVTVAIESDPLEMIARIEVVVRVDGAREDKTVDAKYAGQDEIELALPAGGRLDLRVRALDENGNVLAQLGTAEVPIVIIGKPIVVDKRPEDEDKVVEQPPPQKPVRERPLYGKWWLWGSGALVVAGAATYFGIDGLRAKSDLEDLNATSPNHTFDEALALESRARRSILYANIGYGVAGALAITATILWLTEPDAQPARETRLGAVPIDGGGAIVFGGQF